MHPSRITRTQTFTSPHNFTVVEILSFFFECLFLFSFVKYFFCKVIFILFRVTSENGKWAGFIRLWQERSITYHVTLHLLGWPGYTTLGRSRMNNYLKCCIYSVKKKQIIYLNNNFTVYFFNYEKNYEFIRMPHSKFQNFPVKEAILLKTIKQTLRW